MPLGKQWLMINEIEVFGILPKFSSSSLFASWIGVSHKANFQVHLTYSPISPSSILPAPHLPSVPHKSDLLRDKETRKKLREETLDLGGVWL